MPLPSLFHQLSVNKNQYQENTPLFLGSRRNEHEDWFNILKRPWWATPLEMQVFIAEVLFLMEQQESFL